jgi:hypothetical protein
LSPGEVSALLVERGFLIGLEGVDVDVCCVAGHGNELGL